MDELGIKYSRHNDAKKHGKCHECFFNCAVECDQLKTCDRCGWNPKVAKKRADKVRKALNNQTAEFWLIGSGSYEKSALKCSR